jgi:hypothetical protein
MNPDLIGLIIGLVLTLFIYSYILGDNPLYRLAVHILVGVSAAYAAVVVIREVILPVLVRLREEPTNAANLWLAPVLVLILLFALKRWTGNGAVAFLIAVGSAVALVGAVQGTLLPQITAVSSNPLFPGQGIVTAVLTVCTLLTFQFTRRINSTEPRWQSVLSGIGRAVLMITFGVLYAAVLNTSLLLLADRLNYLLRDIPAQLSELIR